MAQVALMQEARANIIPAINAERDFLVDPNNRAENVFYVDNLKALEAANKAILAANATIPAVIGAAMAPGTQKAPFPYSTEKVRLQPLQLVEVEYQNQFFESDAIAKNHDGQTSVAVPYGSGNAAAVVTMSHFYNQITRGRTGGGYILGSVRDALSYYLYRDQGTGFMVPHLRYKMPVFHYRNILPNNLNIGARYVPISYDTAVTPYSFFNENGTLVTDAAGINGPIANSFEARSLQAAFNYLRLPSNPAKPDSKIIRKETKFGGASFVGWKVNGIVYPKNPLNQAQVPIRILPNFLKGCVIRSEEPKPNTLVRALGNSEIPGYADVWCKIFKRGGEDGISPGFRVPYDKTKIIIPYGYGLAESWTGFLYFIDLRTNHYVDMPVGAVMIGEDCLNFDITEAVNWRDSIYPQIAIALGEIFTAAAGAENNLEMFPTANTPMYKNVDMVSCVLGLAMYLFNLRQIGIELSRQPAISGGYTKKNITSRKNRNMNKRQRQRRSKSKSMSMLKSAKRTFYRTNKRNKTSRQYH